MHSTSPVAWASKERVRTSDLAQITCEWPSVLSSYPLSVIRLKDVKERVEEGRAAALRRAAHVLCGPPCGRRAPGRRISSGGPAAFPAHRSARSRFLRRPPSDDDVPKSRSGRLVLSFELVHTDDRLAHCCRSQDSGTGNWWSRDPTLFVLPCNVTPSSLPRRRAGPMLTIEFPSPCDGCESARRSVFGRLVQVRTPSPTKECNLYRHSCQSGCIRQLHLFILGKSLTNP